MSNPDLNISLFNDYNANLPNYVHPCKRRQKKVFNSVHQIFDLMVWLKAGVGDVWLTEIYLLNLHSEISAAELHTLAGCSGCWMFHIIYLINNIKHK